MNKYYQGMKLTKKDIGKIINSHNMILRDIEPQDKMKRGYTDINYDCYTYGNGFAYYWSK